MDSDKLKNIVEAALLAAGRPMSIEQVLNLFTEHERPERAEIRAAIDALVTEYSERGIQLVEVASGWRIQVRQEMSTWLSRLWQDRPARYSRALLETLALIAYRQPITRGEIEDIRGVSVSSNIMRTLMERGWVRIVGYRDVPGRPGMYATTREFLDYFGLKRLEDLPPLAEIRDLDSIRVELDLELADEAAAMPTAPTEDSGEVEEEVDAGPPQETGRA
jgi:segregation and condensation protein B